MTHLPASATSSTDVHLTAHLTGRDLGYMTMIEAYIYLTGHIRPDVYTVTESTGAAMNGAKWLSSRWEEVA